MAAAGPQMALSRLLLQLIYQLLDKQDALCERTKRMITAEKAAATEEETLEECWTYKKEEITC